MSENTTKKQHYVPQFYLRSFLNENNHLWVYDREKQKIFQSPPDAICQEKDLYEVEWKDADSRLGKYVLHNQIEKMLCSQEGMYSGVIQEIISRCKEPNNYQALICDTKQKKVLSNFIADLIFRNPYLLDDNQEISFNVPQIQSTQELFKGMGWGSAHSLIKFTMRKIRLDDSIKDSDTNKLANLIQQHDFAFLISEKETFVTSSFPVLYGVYEENDVSICIFFPLCPQIAVMYLPRKFGMKYRNRVFKMNDDLVIGGNELFLSLNSKQMRFLISHSKQNVEKFKKRDAHIEKRGDAS